MKDYETEKQSKKCYRKPKADLRFGIGRRRSMEAVVGRAVEMENSLDGGMRERRGRGKRSQSASATLRFTAERGEVEEDVSVVEGREWLGEAQHVRNGRDGVQRHGERDMRVESECVENRNGMEWVSEN